MSVSDSGGYTSGYDSRMDRWPRRAVPANYQFVQQSFGATNIQCKPIAHCVSYCAGCKRCSATNLQNKPSAHAVNVKGAVLLSRRVQTWNFRRKRPWLLLPSGWVLSTVVWEIRGSVSYSHEKAVVKLVVQRHDSVQSRGRLSFQLELVLSHHQRTRVLRWSLRVVTSVR